MSSPSFFQDNSVYTPYLDYDVNYLIECFKNLAYIEVKLKMEVFFMNTMQAFVRTNAKSGHIELQDVEIPSIDQDEVLVKVEASGVIVKVGELVQHFKEGQRVIVSSSMQIKGGCWAEYVVASPDKIIPMLDEIDFLTGAALPVAGKTALESMNALNLSKGDILFIAGASGAIGTLIIQLATNKGVHVIGSASSKNHAYMKSLGAKYTVDYTDPNWKTQVRQQDVDAALAIQPGTGEDCLAVVRDGGKVITVSGDKLEPERNIDTRQFQHQLKIRPTMNELMKDIVANNIKLVIEKTYPFEDALQALEKTETRHARGKLIVVL